MKVMLSVLHFGLLRNFESVVRELTERGHEVLLLADEPDPFGGEELARELAQAPNVDWAWTPSYADSAWFVVARQLRLGLDYLRFLDPPYDRFSKLRDRTVERAPRLVTWLARLPGLRSSLARRVLIRLLEWVNNGMPRLRAMDDLLARERPDVALFGSVTHQRAPQLDHLRSARALRVPTGVCVYSWDHLSSKALIRVVPDRVFVWNDMQRREAIELHGLPPDRIVVTGAQVYDQWFNRSPSRPRDVFLEEVGLPPDRPFILYVCSAFTPDPGEPRFVRRWVEAIRRQGNSSLRRATVLIRPHPERRDDWQDIDWADLAPVVIGGDNPITAHAKSDYFDALAYSEAVVGLVTSAFLEAAIVGRPVLTVTSPEFQTHQHGMLHFRYLLEVEDGLLKVAGTLDEHVQHLEAALAGDQAHVARQRRFLRAFVRPLGIDVAATPGFVEAVEALAETAPVGAPARPPAWQRALAWCVVGAAQRGLVRRALWSALEAAEKRLRDERVRSNRQVSRARWRQHHWQRFVTRLRVRVSTTAQSTSKFVTGRRKWWVHRGRKFIHRLGMAAQAVRRRLPHGPRMH